MKKHYSRSSRRLLVDPFYTGIFQCVAVGLLLLALSGTSRAVEFSVTIRGSDAIWLAGRSDLQVPPPHLQWPRGLRRHKLQTPEEIKETQPKSFSVLPGNILRVVRRAEGGISFYNGFGGLYYGPEGNGVAGSSDLTSFGGISGYLGTEGALVGVFLDDVSPTNHAPPRLDFSERGIGVDFIRLAPRLGQVFFIGDGFTSFGTPQEFTAPPKATRVFLGVTDGFGFDGHPGAYDDNDGQYSIGVRIE